jgi:iron-sulfur cluster repair protein YtfE (RIC family)
MAASIDSVAPVLSASDIELMKLSHKENQTVADIAFRVPKALEISKKYRLKFREVAEEKYDWKNVSNKLANELKHLML